MTLIDSRPSEASEASVIATGTSLRVVSLFSGIGGIDSGLEGAGHHVVEMCEFWEPARRVLQARFPQVHVDDDVRTYNPKLEYDLLTAGFPCVDLSHAGSQSGIFGAQSGLVEHVFRIAKDTRPNWILLENVPNLLKLHKGAGIRYIIDSLEDLGYSWAYRVVDSRAFGVAQRRNRVIFLASLTGDPRHVLLAQDSSSDERPTVETAADASGFYWTEGRRGVGLVIGAVPTLKGGSTLGLPSAPAIWMPHAAQGKRIVLPSVEDAEELQGFERGWSLPADEGEKRSYRWKVVGNAVTVGLASWLGERLARHSSDTFARFNVAPLRNESKPWPDAAFGGRGRVWTSAASRMPVVMPSKTLASTVDGRTTTPLSYRATKGFLSRLEESGLGIPDAFMRDLESHMGKMRTNVEAKQAVAAVPNTSWASSPAVRKRMQATKSKNTTPELQLRRALADHGLRYRLQIRPEPALRWRSDIVYIGARVIVDVRGCFWHVCPIHQSWPKANAERWAEKLERNRLRDLRMVDELTAAGWKVITVWQHDNPVDAAAEIVRVVRERRANAGRSKIVTVDSTEVPVLVEAS